MATKRQSSTKNISVNLGGELSGGGINPGGLDGQLFPAIDHSGTATNDNVYMLAIVQPPGVLSPK